MREPWKPGRNLGGEIFYDPQRELSYWIRRAAPHDMVSVPVATLVACLNRHECSARTVLQSDDEGYIGPIEIICRRPQNHADDGVAKHSNGYTTWED